MPGSEDCVVGADSYFELTTARLYNFRRFRFAWSMLCQLTLKEPRVDPLNPLMGYMYVGVRARTLLKMSESFHFPHDGALVG